MTSLQRYLLERNVEAGSNLTAATSLLLLELRFPTTAEAMNDFRCAAAVAVVTYRETTAELVEGMVSQ